MAWIKVAEFYYYWKLEVLIHFQKYLSNKPLFLWIYRRNNPLGMSEGVEREKVIANRQRVYY